MSYEIYHEHFQTKDKIGLLIEKLGESLWDLMQSRKKFSDSLGACSSTSVETQPLEFQTQQSMIN
jgi:hypothetical protein